MTLAERRQRRDIPQERFYPSFNGQGEFRVTSSRDKMVVNLGNSIIDVEVAKRPGSIWRHRENIDQARASYRAMWGDVPTWDNYDRDPLTYNYIAYVHYPDTNGANTVETLSNRMVLRDPEDVEFYQLDGMPLRIVLDEYLYGDTQGKHKVIAGESRIGAIKPPFSNSNLKTLEAFAAIKLKMVEDARAQDIDYIACQVRPDFSSNVFTINGTTYDFPLTEDLLGIPRGSIKLNRDNIAVARHLLNFPGYFLDNNSIYVVIKNLIEDRELSINQFIAMTGLSDPANLRKAKNIKELARLISSETAIGALLRLKLLKEVPDGTHSSVSHVNDIEQRALRVLKEISHLNL